MRRKRNSWFRLLQGLFLPVAAALVLLCLASALNSLNNGRSAEDLHQLEEAIRRGCVACYAAEGLYPPNLDYLKAHYGIQIDETRYMVYYDVFGSNLMPDITVLEREP